MKLQSIRKSKKMSCKRLAEKSGVPMRSIQYYEMRPDTFDGAKLSTLLKLSEALDCKIYDILESDELIEKLKHRV